MKFLYLALASLAAFRIALMVSSEEGPARLFWRIRHIPKPHSNAREGLSCEWCLAVYAGAVLATYLFWLGVFPGREWPLWWLAISAGALVLNQQFIAKLK
jgi:fatty acid desaturase